MRVERTSHLLALHHPHKEATSYRSSPSGHAATFSGRLNSLPRRGGRTPIGTDSRRRVIDHGGASTVRHTPVGLIPTSRAHVDTPTMLRLRQRRG